MTGLAGWLTGLVLLLVGLGGLVGAAMAFTRRRVEVSPYVVEGRGAILVGLVYLGGGLVALGVLALWALNGWRY